MATRMSRTTGESARDPLRALLRATREVEKATLVRELPGRVEEYRFEIKYDGYRILALKSGDEARLVSRNGKDWTDRFPTIAAAVARLRVHDAVLDGEVCALDREGIPSFHLLQNPGAGATLSYPVFDLLWLNGEDQRRLPLEDRRARLEKIMRGTRDPLALSTTIEGSDWRKILNAACSAGLEGVIAKKLGSPYTPGRSKDWLKLKCSQRQEFALVGYLPMTGTTNAVGSLLLAIADGDGGFLFAGKVGTGFNNEARKELARKLDAHRIDAANVTGMPRIRAAHLSAPRLVGEVSFTEWTPDGKVRHPVFQGLRADKSPRDCVREEPIYST